MSMPGAVSYTSSINYWGQSLTDYIQNGTIQEDRLTDMVERVVAAWYLVGQDKDFPEGLESELADVQSDHYNIVREVGAAGTVLLKNVTGALPLKSPKSIAIIGAPSLHCI